MGTLTNLLGEKTFLKWKSENSLFSRRRISSLAKTVLNKAVLPLVVTSAIVFTSPMISSSFDSNYKNSNPIIQQVNNYMAKSGVSYAATCTDADNDGYYKEPGCGTPADCNDGDADINPGVDEICDGLDNNCDGDIDEGVTTTYYRDLDADSYGDPSISREECYLPSGYTTNGGDCDDGNSSIHPEAEEVCDGVDNNCNGSIDEGVQTTYYHDNDGDSFGNSSSSVLACSAPPSYVLDDTDCNDNDPNIYPGATETCNGIDDNCNGSIDEGVQTTYYHDNDGDSFGNSSSSVLACSAPPSYVLDDTDCNDNNPNINPEAEEVCDGIDNNCDGVIDAVNLTDSNNSFLYSNNSGSFNASFYADIPRDEVSAICLSSEEGNSSVCFSYDEKGAMVEISSKTGDETKTPTFSFGGNFMNKELYQKALYDAQNNRLTIEISSDLEGLLAKASTILPFTFSNQIEYAVSDTDKYSNPIHSDAEISTTVCPICTDGDGDGYYFEDGCGTPLDCDDGNPAVNPGATETCGNGADDDCIGGDEVCPDEDGGGCSVATNIPEYLHNDSTSTLTKIVNSSLPFLPLGIAWAIKKKKEYFAKQNKIH